MVEKTVRFTLNEESVCYLLEILEERKYPEYVFVEPPDKELFGAIWRKRNIHKHMLLILNNLIEQF
jgi:hypothetical protein